MKSTWAFEHRHGIKGNIQGTWICNEYLHGVNTGMGIQAQDETMQQLFSSQGSGGGAPGKLTTLCLWQIKGNIQGTWIWNEYEHGREHRHRTK